MRQWPEVSCLLRSLGYSPKSGGNLKLSERLGEEAEVVVEAEVEAEVGDAVDFLPRMQTLLELQILAGITGTGRNFQLKTTFADPPLFAT